MNKIEETILLKNEEKFLIALQVTYFPPITFDNTAIIKSQTQHQNSRYIDQLG